MPNSSRYSSRRIFKTRHPLYAKDLKNRGLKFFRYYETPRFKEPTDFELDEIEDVGHEWVIGDRYYKLAFEYYGAAEFWWIIAWYNNKPTEAHLKLGDVISIPTPLWKVRAAYGV